MPLLSDYSFLHSVLHDEPLLIAQCPVRACMIHASHVRIRTCDHVDYVASLTLEDSVYRAYAGACGLALCGP